MRKRNAGRTYSAFAESEADEPRGRFGTIGKPMVTGSSELVEYPAQPENSPWHHDPVPPEPPLNFQEISAPEPVGTAQETEASLGDAQRDGTSQPSYAVERPCGGGECSDANPPAVSFETPLPPFSKRKRRKS